MGKKPRIDASGVVARGFAGKGHEGAFYNDGNILYLDRGFGCIGINIYWNTLAAHLRFMHFTV